MSASIPEVRKLTGNVVFLSKKRDLAITVINGRYCIKVWHVELNSSGWEATASIPPEALEALKKLPSDPSQATIITFDMLCQIMDAMRDASNLMLFVVNVACNRDQLSHVIRETLPTSVLLAERSQGDQFYVDDGFIVMNYVVLARDWVQAHKTLFKPISDAYAHGKVCYNHTMIAVSEAEKLRQKPVFLSADEVDDIVSSAASVIVSLSAPGEPSCCNSGPDCNKVSF